MKSDLEAEEIGSIQESEVRCLC